MTQDTEIIRDHIFAGNIWIKNTETHTGCRGTVSERGPLSRDRLDQELRLRDAAFPTTCSHFQHEANLSMSIFQHKFHSMD